MIRFLHLFQATLACMAMSVAQANATLVQFQTILGDFNVELFDEQVPATVENFLIYVDSGAYNQTIIHRSVKDFIIQGGGFTFEDTGPAEMIALHPAIINEPVLSNIAGTLVMARIGGSVNSAQSQWFFNLVNNKFLDDVDEGFTVFGEVVGDGMVVVNAIAALKRFDRSSMNSAFSALPLHDYSTGTVSEDHIVYVHAIVRVESLIDSPFAPSSSSASSASISSSSSSLAAFSESSTSTQSSSAESSESSSVSESSIANSSSESSVSSSASSSSAAVVSGGISSTSGAGGGGGSLGFAGILFLWLFGRRIHIKSS